MIVYLVIVLVSCSCAPFEIEMPTLQEERLAIKMRVDGKEVLGKSYPIQPMSISMRIA